MIELSFLGVSFTKVAEHTEKTGLFTSPSVSQSVSSRSPRAHRTIVSNMLKGLAPPLNNRSISYTRVALTYNLAYSSTTLKVLYIRCVHHR